MNIGLLWFDDTPSTDLEEKVRRATAHYERKHGHPPNTCFVNPTAFGGNGKRKRKKVGGVVIRPGRSILPHHFWLGREDEDERAE